MLVAVCCQGADTVVLVDLDALERVGTIPVGGHPVHATVAADRTFVATMDERSVSVIDTDGSVRTVSTGVLGPSHFERAAGRVFVSCTGGDAIAAIDPEALALDGRVHTGVEPHGLTTYRGRVFAGSRGDGTVTVVDPDRLEPLGTIDAGDGARVQDLEAGPDGVFAVDQSGDRVIKVEEGEVLATAPVGADPYDVTVTDDAVFVPGRGDGTVHAFDHALDGPTVYETGPGAAVVVDLEGERWVAHRQASHLATLSGTRIELPHSGHNLVAVDGALLVAGYDDAAVTLVDVEDRRVVGTVDVDANPLGMLPV